MKIKQIDTIVLTNPIWWDNYNMASKVRAEVEQTIDGGVIVYEQALLPSSENVDLSSGTETGWQTDVVKDSLLTHVNASLGTTFNIITTDDTIIECRYRHEAGAMSFERVIETLDSAYYTCQIKLAKV